MPVYPSGYFRGLAQSYEAVDRMYEEQKQAAMRWQGAQDYQTLVQSGIDPRDALRRTAPKLFYNDPRALAATVPSMLSEPGGLVTDPETGRRFTVDRFGNYKAVSEPQYGWRKVSDPYGNSYTIRLGPGEEVPTGQEPRQAPPIYTAPGGGRFFLLPGGKVRNVPRDPVSAAEAKKMLEENQKAAGPILKQYQEWAAEDKAGQVRWGPDWLGFNESYKAKMARAEEQLKQLGFDTQGRILPDSRLGEAYYGATGGDVGTTTGQLQGGPAVPTRTPSPGMMPGAPAGGVMPPPVRPRLQQTPLPGGGYMLRPAPNQVGAPTQPAQPAQPAATPRPGGDWVIKYTRDGRQVLVNQKTGERMWYGQ